MIAGPKSNVEGSTPSTPTPRLSPALPPAPGTPSADASAPGAIARISVLTERSSTLQLQSIQISDAEIVPSLNFDTRVLVGAAAPFIGATRITEISMQTLLPAVRAPKYW